MWLSSYGSGQTDISYSSQQFAPLRGEAKINQHYDPCSSEHMERSRYSQSCSRALGQSDVTPPVVINDF